MLSGRKLALTLVFTGLVALATGVSCRGFFVSPVLQSIAVSPTTVNVGIGQQTTLQVFGTYDDGSRSVVTSGVSWSADPLGVVTIVGTGSATITGVTTGSTTITADAQALTATSAATVIGDVTQIVGSPTSGNVTVGEVPGQAFSFAGTPGPPTYITTGNGGTLTITPDDGFVTCTVSVDENNNPNEVCTAATGFTSPSYALVMTYPSPSGGTTTSNTVTLNVSE
ncbi:MAG TPA: hypothetical protein VIH78_08095 [Terriglobales bacterium]|jgi:hypothetical protein